MKSLYCNFPRRTTYHRFNVARYYSSPVTKNNLNALRGEALTAEKLLILDNYKESAANFNHWINNIEQFYDKKISILYGTSDFEFNEYVPSAIRAFLRCNCIDCYTHIKHLLMSETVDNTESNILHYLAESDAHRNEEFYKELLISLARENKQNLLLKKNISGNTPIDVALLHNNKQFIKLTKEICGKPTISDIENTNVLYYLSLRDNIDTDLELLLFGQ
jgi:hypothetical protein